MDKLEWTPSQGEVVWIKVFSNWSKGTYIGYDVIKNQHLVRESEEGGGHLLISADVLPEHANPNESKIDKKLSSIDWLEEQIKDVFYVAEASEMTKKFKSVYEQAKAMHKEEIVDAYNESFRLRDKPYSTAVKYYNETFGGNNE